MKPLNVKVYADGATPEQMKQYCAGTLVQGFTTNPTLMRKLGVADYESFAKEAIAIAGNRPISFEVFADDDALMVEQALKIADWGNNVYVKIPVVNTAGRTTNGAISILSLEGIKLNVTAVFTREQVRTTLYALKGTTPAVISVFAGRIADTGRNPFYLMEDILQMVRASGRKNTEVLWASPRQVFDAVQAGRVGADIITMTPDLIAKFGVFDKDLTEFSVETVKMFYDDARAAGYSL